MNQHKQKITSILTAAILLSSLMTIGTIQQVFAHPNVTDTAISFSENPATAGDIVDITGKVTFTGAVGSGNVAGHGTLPSSGDAVVGDTIQIQQAMDDNSTQLDLGDDFPTSCANQDYFANQTPGAVTNVSGEYTLNFDTTGLAGQTIGFRAHHPSSGGPHANGQSASPCVDLGINSACSGVRIAAELADGDGIPGPGTSHIWTMRMTVDACEDVTGVTAQGGMNAWAPFVTGSFVSSTGTVDVKKDTKKNKIVLWNIGDMNAGDEETLVFEVGGKVSQVCDAVQYLTGPWSAKFSTDGGTTIQKSDYTGRVTITVTCV